MSKEALIPLAEIARPHGVRGELRLKVYNADSDLLLDVSEVIVERADRTREPMKIVSARRANEAILVFLDGVRDRDEADAMRGAKLLLPREAFPPLEPGEFYACDVVGLRVVAPDGEIGVVVELYPYPTCDALIVTTPRGRIEIPVVDDVVEAVDVAGGVVRVVSRAASEPG